MVRFARHLRHYRPVVTACFCTLTVMLLFGPTIQADTLTTPLEPSSEAAFDTEVSELLSNLAHDLTRIKLREREQIEKLGHTATSAAETSRPAAAQARISIYNAPSALRMPIVGLTTADLDDNFGDPRDGGVRKHLGIDIFAPRGAQIVAVTDGYVSYIGEQGKGGRCLWLVNDNGTSFYYAHLDRWAPGLYEGMEVASGSLLGYVGTTGNAVHTPPHLHFQVVDNDATVNPYPLLKQASVSVKGTLVNRLSHGFGK